MEEPLTPKDLAHYMKVQLGQMQCAILRVEMIVAELRAELAQLVADRLRDKQETYRRLGILKEPIRVDELPTPVEFIDPNAPLGWDEII